MKKILKKIIVLACAPILLILILLICIFSINNHALNKAHEHCEKIEIGKNINSIPIISKDDDYFYYYSESTTTHYHNYSGFWFAGGRCEVTETDGIVKSKKVAKYDD